MVDISNKPVVRREALATGKIFVQPETIELIKNLKISKGEVLSVARIAAISGAKKTSALIPLCHNIPINHIEVEFSLKKNHIWITARAVSEGKTGVEMEALTAVSLAALTIYDMCKAVDKKMIISEITLKKKTKNEFHS